jgi:L-rhamnose mutarotase
MSVQRTCLALDLQDDQSLIATYEEYHSPDGIWPGIPEGIREAGILDMQIYRIGTRLFMIVDFDDNTSLKAAFEKMGQMPGQSEWAKLMNSFQKKLPEAPDGQYWAVMKPVFLLNDHIK